MIMDTICTQCFSNLSNNVTSVTIILFMIYSKITILFILLFYLLSSLFYMHFESNETVFDKIQHASNSGQQTEGKAVSMSHLSVAARRQIRRVPCWRSRQPHVAISLCSLLCIDFMEGKKERKKECSRI